MAVCENATGQYYKVLLEDSYIQDGFVFVSAVRYPNQEERDRGRPGAPPSAGTDFMQRSFDMNTAGFVCGGAGNHPFDGRSPALS